MRDVASRAHEVIRVDAAWFAVEPLDMRAGVDKALARVVNVFGEARAHHAYLFVNKRANRMKGRGTNVGAVTSACNNSAKAGRHAALPYRRSRSAA
jgi:transposase